LNGIERTNAGNRVDRRRVRTRSALIGAGQKLFAARSIDGVTIDDIVEAADVAKGSFYNHFNGKENLADTIVELVQGDCEREVHAANLGFSGAADRVARAMATLIRYAKNHPDRYRSMVSLSKRRAQIDAPINTGLRHDIEAGLKNGDFSGISREAGMLAVFGLIATAVDHLAVSRPGRDPAEVAQEMAFLLLRALGVDGDRAKAIAERSAADLFPPAAELAE
jgi:AcrR family transcriptional regulator